MKKGIIIFVLVLLLSIYFVNSITIFIYNETDLVSLQTEADDPDAQELTYSYSEPLDDKGEWQTTYGDAGKYKITITVSDGELSTSEDVLIVVQKKEEKPTIDSFEPNVKDVNVDEGKILKFDIKASDLNKGELDYSWFLDDKKVAEGNIIDFSPNYGDSGNYKIKVVVSDGKNIVSNEWNVRVNEVDINSILDTIKDVTVTETEVVKLDLLNFKKYDLSYKISEPLGDDNYWLTDYDSKGEYLVTVDVGGKGFFGSKEVKVVVKNKDRPTKFDIKGLYFVKENEDLRIELKAFDPDKDEITFSSTNIPEGSSFMDNIFEWKPSYDIVKKESIVDYVLDKFHLLTKSFTVTFIAITKNGRVERDVKIVVQDTNRPFVIEELETIEVNENDIVKIEPEYNDPDNDKVSFTYSGWMNKDVYKTTYGDAGEYYVKIKGTDGYYDAYRFVKIIVKKSNREPVFSKIGNFEIDENESLKIELKAEDPDKDEIDFSSINLPAGSVLKDNLFSWQPNFDFVSKEEGKKSIVVDFIASDNKEEVIESSTITVYDKNRAPEIIEVSEETIVNVNEPIVFWVNAEDKDLDELTYEWVFSRFEKYEATAVHERIFKSKGSKKVKVIVSDGFETAEHEWDVKVV